MKKWVIALLALGLATPVHAEEKFGGNSGSYVTPPIASGQIIVSGPDGTFAWYTLAGGNGNCYLQINGPGSVSLICPNFGGGGGHQVPGGPPQVVGYSTTDQNEAQTFVGDVTLQRTAPNTLTASVVAITAPLPSLQVNGPVGINGPLSVTGTTIVNNITGTTANFTNGTISGILNFGPSGALYFNGFPMGGTCPDGQFVNTINARGVPTCGAPPSGGPVTSPTPPTNPVDGQLWFDPTTLQTYIWYNDGTSSQWIPLVNIATGGGGGSFDNPVFTGTVTFPDGTTWNSNMVYFNDNTVINFPNLMNFPGGWYSWDGTPQQASWDTNGIEQLYEINTQYVTLPVPLPANQPSTANAPDNLEILVQTNPDDNAHSNPWGQYTLQNVGAPASPDSGNTQTWQAEGLMFINGIGIHSSTWDNISVGCSMSDVNGAYLSDCAVAAVAPGLRNNVNYKMIVQNTGTGNTAAASYVLKNNYPHTAVTTLTGTGLTPTVGANADEYDLVTNAANGINFILVNDAGTTGTPVTQMTTNSVNFPAGVVRLNGGFNQLLFGTGSIFDFGIQAPAGAGFAQVGMGCDQCPTLQFQSGATNQIIQQWGNFNISSGYLDLADFATPPATGVTSGSMYYNTTRQKLQIFTTAWEDVCSGATGPGCPTSTGGNFLPINNPTYTGLLSATPTSTNSNMVAQFGPGSINSSTNASVWFTIADAAHQSNGQWIADQANASGITMAGASMNIWANGGNALTPGSSFNPFTVMSFTGTSVTVPVAFNSTLGGSSIFIPGSGTGGYNLGTISGVSGFEMVGGRRGTNGAATAESANSSGIYFANNIITFQSNSGLTPGSTFTPFTTATMSGQTLALPNRYTTLVFNNTAIPGQAMGAIGSNGYPELDLQAGAVTSSTTGQSIATSQTSGAIIVYGGGVQFYQDYNLTAGSSFTPTIVGEFTSTGLTIYPLVSATTGSNINFGSTGLPGPAGSTNVSVGNFVNASGAYQVGNTWTATAATAVLENLSGASGNVAFYSNTGLTVGQTFTPTIIAEIIAPSNSDMGLRVATANTGNNASASVMANSQSYTAQMTMYGTGYTSNPNIAANTAVFGGNGPTGVDVIAFQNAATAFVRMWSGGGFTGAFGAGPDGFYGLMLPGYAARISGNNGNSSLSLGNIYMSGTAFATGGISGAAFYNGTTWMSDGGGGGGSALFQLQGNCLAMYNAGSLAGGVAVPWTEIYANCGSGESITHINNLQSARIPNITSGVLVAGSRDTFGWITNVTGGETTITFAEAFLGDSTCTLTPSSTPMIWFNASQSALADTFVCYDPTTGNRCADGQTVEYHCFGQGDASTEKNQP